MCSDTPRRQEVPIGVYVARSQYGLNSISARDGNIPIIGMKDMAAGRVAANAWARTHVDESQLPEYLLQKGDILLNRTNSPDLVGKVSLWDREEEAVFASYLVRFQFDAAHALPEFVNHYLNWEDSQQRLKQISTRGVSQANINPTTFQNHFMVAWPPLTEQRRIAAVLDEWDRAITTAEKLAKAKLVRKDGLARKLLDLCLVDHAPQGWVTALLGDLFEERTTVGGSERLLAVTAGQGIIDRDETGRKDTSADDKSSYKLIEPGDIGYNTMRMWQGVSALSSLRGLVSPAYTIVRPNADIDAQFAAQLFKYNHMIHTFWRYSQGLVDDTLMLKFPQFSEIKINIPPLDVQRETGEILSGADLEVGQLQDLRNQLRMQKRGLMQKLLSGDWPVPASIDRLLPGGQDIDEGVEAEEQRAEATG